MNPIKNKLRSKSGASLLFALLFLLFCVLVGGTVLAAASAGGFRVTRMENKQQELSERSVAQLVADELDKRQDNFALTVEKTGGSALEFKLEKDTPMNPMQRLTVEMAVWKYLKEAGYTGGTLTFTNFKYYDGAETKSIGSLDDFWFRYNTSSTADFVGTVALNGELQSGGTDIVNQEVQFGLSKSAGNYNLTVDLGQDSRYSVQMKAKVTNHADGSGEIASTTISWYAPVVKKGGS
jgi:hypothetical protein